MQLLKLFYKARDEIQTLVMPGLGKNGIATMKSIGNVLLKLSGKHRDDQFIINL